jgi:hypothetical protein
MRNGTLSVEDLHLFRIYPEHFPIIGDEVSHFYDILNFNFFKELFVLKF